jgi:hypothetical protein
MAKFERKDARVTVAFLKCTRENWQGKTFTSLTATRAIKEREGWRIDRADAVAGTWTPWEPLTTDTYRTLAAAKTTIRAFEKVCRLKPGSPERKQYGLSGRSRRR